MPISAAARDALRDLPLDGEGAAFAQIYRAIRRAILAGRAPSGTRLPSSRALAADLGVSRNTVLAAYDQLLAEGYVVARTGAGTFVAPQLPEAPQTKPPVPASAEVAPDPAHRLSRYGAALPVDDLRTFYDADRGRVPVRFDFRPCVPDLEGLPSEDWRRCVSRRASLAPAEAFDYADPSGSLALRREIAGHLVRARGVRCRAEEIVVVGGVAQALDLTSRLLLDPGDTALIEEPHYIGARRAFSSVGAALAPVAVDAEGIDVDSLAASVRDRARLAYLTPSHQFPTGAVLSLRRRLRVLDWAERANAFVIEDDYDSEFRYAGQAIEALKSLDARGRVIYLGTFSKTLFPSLRIAYLVLPPALVDVFRTAKWTADWASPTLEQEALADFMASRGFERHVRRARTLYGRRRAALLDALRAELSEGAVYRDSRAGLHVLLRLSAIPSARTSELARAALARDVRVYPAAACRFAPARDSELILGFTRIPEEEMREGVRRLADAAREVVNAPAAP